MGTRGARAEQSNDHDALIPVIPSESALPKSLPLVAAPEAARRYQYPTIARLASDEYFELSPRLTADRAPMSQSIKVLLEGILAPDFFSQRTDQIRRSARSLLQHWDQIEGFQSKRVVVLAGWSTDYLIEILRVALLRRGVKADIEGAGYGQLVAPVLTGSEAIRASDLVLMLPSHRDLQHAPGTGCTTAEANDAAAKEADFWINLIGRVTTPVIFLSFDQPLLRALGEHSGFLPGSLGRHARETNLRLYDGLPVHASLVDGEALQARLGRDWNDPYIYNLCKQPFAMSALPSVADTLAAQATAAFGRSAKVLVLDLDNTLWGGIVGDAGSEGLELGSETPEGEGFTNFQTFAKQLSSRGVILAVCSKNTESIAWTTFCNHPAMVLKPDDIAAYVINFHDKAENLRQISKAINIGLDAFVFADDSPIEREWVHRALPMVRVIDLPDNPAYYARTLSDSNLFPLMRLTAEDLTRTSSYRAMAVVRAHANEEGDFESFLRDLQPQAVLEPVCKDNADRIAQLIAKTNQFKLNPRTLTISEVYERSKDIVALRLRDRLQDYGIVAVAVTTVNHQARRLVIENWVMSCRVFNRRLENLTIDVLVRKARAGQADAIELRYVPSSKNVIIPDALHRLGFTQEDEGSYCRLLDATNAERHFISIEGMSSDG